VEDCNVLFKEQSMIFWQSQGSCMPVAFALIVTSSTMRSSTKTSSTKNAETASTGDDSNLA
jgi:hypothetical protein